MAQQRAQVEPAHPPVLALQGVDVLVLREDGPVMHEGQQPLEDRVALPVRYKAEPQGRDDRVNLGIAPLTQLQIHVFGAGMDQNQTRIGK